MAQNNSINNASGYLTVDSAAATDSFIQLNINTTGEWRFGCDATDSSFRLSQGSALGTNDTFIVSSAGEVTMPLQPLFMASQVQELNCTGDGTAHQMGSVAAMGELFDVGGDFTPGNGAGTGATFTAPITGLYNLNMSEANYDNNATNGGTVFSHQIVTSNRTYTNTALPTQRTITNFYGVNTYLTLIGSVLADMDASDTALFVVQASGGSKTDAVENVGNRVSVCGALFF